MSSYELSRSWFDFCFENPDKIKPNHTALYFFAIEHCNRLGWKQKFGLPTTMVMEAIGIKSYNTYIKTLNEVIEFGFINIVERSRNQYSANIIELSKFDKALNKALDKALIKHATKQSESTQQSISSIDKQYNKEQLNQLTRNHKEVKAFLESISTHSYLYSKFYDKELTDNENNSQITAYTAFVKFLHGKNSTNEKLKKVLTMQNQISYANYLELAEIRRASGKDLKDTILNLENFTGKKYKSFMLTLRSWMKNGNKQFTTAGNRN